MTMHWRTPPKLWLSLKPVAKELRLDPTPDEDLVWQHVRGSKLGAKFRRQHPIDRFIVDFYCRQASLVVEIDGPVHQYTRQEDALRQEFLESLGLTVIRFTNEQVRDDIEEVIEKIQSHVEASSAEVSTESGSPSPSTERGSGGEVSP